MTYELPNLPYSFDALEPHIDAQTMEIHHGKHHAGYVHNLNAALEGNDELLQMPVEELLRNIETVPQSVRQAVINNAGGHANHSLFWKIMSPEGGGEPTGDLADAIAKDFGSFETFKVDLSTKAKTLFGSGWVFLVVDNGKLVLKRHSFQNSPYMHGQVPILGLDVWEHAYYLKYQNKRTDYIDAWWNVINWDQVSTNLATAMKAS